MEYNYKKELEIDIYNLDKELERQSVLFMKYAEAEVDASDERDRKKRALDVLRADLDKEIRSKDPKKYGIEKFTEAAIAGLILTDERYKAAELEFLEKNKRTKLLGSAKEAFEQRKRMIEKLVDLYISGVYSVPRQRKSEDAKEGTASHKENLKTGATADRLEESRRRKENA